MSSELEEAIVDNVIHRGIGFMALHCTCWSPDYDKFNEMIGIKGIMHGPVQNVFMHNFNSGHPISAGIDDFIMPLDENFGVELTHSTNFPREKNRLNSGVIGRKLSDRY